MGSALQQLRVRTPRATVVAACGICGRKMLTDQPEAAYHVECFAKPKPCECGQPSMPYPLCTHCKGSGRLEALPCPYCPPGPCVSCAYAELRTRILEARQ